MRILGQDFSFHLVKLGLGSTEEQKAVAFLGHGFCIGQTNAVGGAGHNRPTIGSRLPFGTEAKKIADEVSPEGLHKFDASPEGDQKSD